MKPDSTFLINEVLVAVGLVLSLGLFSVIGSWAGRRFRRSDTDSTSDVTPGALLTLLSLLLAFGVSMADVRFEARKEIELKESNAIGTSYLRSVVLPDGEAKKTRRILREYLEERIHYYEQSRSDPSQRSLSLQQEFWKMASDYAVKKPSPTVALLLTSLNQTIDLQEKQTFFFQNRVPRSIRWLLYFVSCIVLLTTGFSHGSSAQRHRVVTLALSVVVAMTLFVILDLDIPRAGLIRIAPESMLRLKASMQSQSDS